VKVAGVHAERRLPSVRYVCAAARFVRMRDTSRNATIEQHRTPAAPAEYTISIPIARDDLDLAHASVPAGLHIAAWKVRA
jgi:hypothetical protein